MFNSKLAITSMALLLGLLAVGCGEDGSQGPPGVPGANGANGTNGANGANGIVPAPTATSVTPAVGNGGGGTVITIAGTNFVPGFTTVTVGGAAATVTTVTANSITATVPAGVNGSQPVVVTTPGGTVTVPGGFSFNTAVLFVANSGDANINEFPNTQSNNTAPFRTLTTSAANGKITANTGELFVTHPSTGEVQVFASGTTSGATFLRTIGGIGAPNAVSVSGAELYVTSGGNAVRVYSKNSAGFPFPNRTLTGFNNIRDLFGGGSVLWIAEAGTNRVLLVDGAGDGAVNPTREIGGGATGFSSVEAVAIFNGEVYVYDRGNSTIRVFPIAQNGGAAPTRTFGVTASAAGGDFVIFNNELYLTLASANQVEVYNPTTGALIRTIPNPGASFNAPAGIVVDNTVTPP